MATAPTLGYGQRGEAPIDAVNQWMRGTSWYQSLIRSFGQQPNNVHLSDDQKQQVIRAAQANGVVVDEGGNGQEIDNSGNFQAKGHKLRNTLIVAGVAAAAIATAGIALAPTAGVAGTGATVAGVEGGAYGVGAGTVAALGTGAMAAVPVTAATTAAISTAAASIGPAAAQAAAAKVAASGGAITAENILKYALPVAGNLVGGLIQANAAGNASDAQQKYLEEALAYQKEQDTYARTRQAGLDAQEVQRYGDYQGRIKGFIDNGQNSNDRMSALLGLAPRANVGSSAPSYSSRSSGGDNQGVPVSPEITAWLAAHYKTLGLTPSGRGTGPTDIAYYADQMAATGGLTDANKGFWTDRIATDAAKAGLKGTPGAPTAPPTPTTAPPVLPSTSTTPPSTPTTPQSAASVLMRAPDGSTQRVDPAHVDHYTQLGAKPVDTASQSQVQMRGPDGSVKTVSADQVDHYTQLGATVLGVAA